VRNLNTIMCGIFALLNNSANATPLTSSYLQEQFNKGRHRGPEFSVYKTAMIKADIGFHRLAINGLNSESNQPIIIDDIALVCNGEIYNFKELYAQMPHIEVETDSDCEVILHLYKEYGIEYTLQVLDGVFSFILIDYRYDRDESKIYVARDPYGIRPLYTLMAELSGEPIYAFASELKMLSDIAHTLSGPKTKIGNIDPAYKVEQFLPGTFSEFTMPFKVSPTWSASRTNIVYHTPGFHTNMMGKEVTLDHARLGIRTYFTKAVEKRCAATERPVAALLSGGLDSSLVAAIAAQYMKENGLPVLETYSIGLEGSEDLRYAQLVAEHIGSDHHEVLVTEADFTSAIRDVIVDIESYDTTTVRASLGNWLLGKYISEHSQAKVILNGDGSDELTGGYLYMKCAPNAMEFDKECRRLLKDIYLFDVLRSDKSISSHGLEPRTPFLDRTWVQYYLSLPLSLRYPNDENSRNNDENSRNDDENSRNDDENNSNGNSVEKYLLRSAFSQDQMDFNLLPEEVLWRRKEAFSDGVSKTTRSLYEILQEYAAKTIRDKAMNIHHLIPKTTEQMLYRQIFEECYPGMSKIVPYFWMPKYVEAADASARTLSIYTPLKI